MRPLHEDYFLVDENMLVTNSLVSSERFRKLRLTLVCSTRIFHEIRQKVGIRVLTSNESQLYRPLKNRQYACTRPACQYTKEEYMPGRIVRIQISDLIGGKRKSSPDSLSLTLCYGTFFFIAIERIRLALLVLKCISFYP